MALDLAAELAAVMGKPRRLPRATMETLAIIARIGSGKMLV
jgi:chromosome segregation and condensation protein ScpB